MEERFPQLRRYAPVQPDAGGAGGDDNKSLLDDYDDQGAVSCVSVCVMITFVFVICHSFMRCGTEAAAEI